MYTPESTTENDLNLDSTLGLFRVLSLFSNPSMQQGTEDDSNSYFAVNQFQRLTPMELNTIFRSSFIARKIIEKYPNEAKNLGYQLVDNNGKIIASDDVLLLGIIYDSLIWSRLYGHCYTIFLYKKNDVNEPLIPRDKLTGHKIEFSLKREGDYFIKSDKEKYHYTKVQYFYGRKTYIPFIDIDDENYADSHLQSIAVSLKNYVSSNETLRKILSNISYLLLGIKNLGNMTKSEKGLESVHQRLASVRVNRNVNRAIVYDLENEALSYISQSTTGLNDLIDNIKEIFIAESDYPASELFEESAKQNIGSGLANQLIARFLWAKRCHTYTKNDVLEHYQLFYDRHFTNKNYIVQIPFKMELSQIEQAELEKFASERNKNLIESNIISPEEARTGYRTEEFDLNIILDDELYQKYVTSSKKTSDNSSINSGLEEPNTTLEPDKNLDAVFVPNDQIWEELASISESELDDVMVEALNDL